MKKYLKNQDGMALAMVLILMTIVMVMSAGTAVLAYNSYVSVRWLNEEKQAHYLARAGVEAASYAYQDAIAGAAPTNFIKVAEEGGDNDIITSCKVYAYYTKSATATSNTIWDGFEFRTTAPRETDGVVDPAYFGYFEVRIGNGTDKVLVKQENGTSTETDSPVKVFESVAHVGSVQRTVYAYITPAETISGTTLYDENGVLKREVGANAFTSKETVIVDYEKLETDTGIQSSDGFFTKVGKIVKSLFKGFLNQVYKQLANAKDADGNYIFPNFPRKRQIDMYIKTSDSTLVLTKPAKSNVIKGGPKTSDASAQKDNTQNYGDNFYSISTGGNLFLRDTGIDATPEKGQYNSIGLYGNQIIIDGNIILYAYITNPDSLAGSSLTSTVALLGNRFCLGTVMLGHARVYDRNDSALFRDKGITDENGNDVAANKVYFNGNVVLKLYTQGVGVETYRIFNAGDMAYFYGSYTDTSTVNTSSGAKNKETTGIDLLKYFVDAVIAGRDGYHIYGDAVVDKMKQVKEIYYGADTPSYFEGNTVLFKRLAVTTDNKGSVLVNGEKGRINEIIPPMPNSAATIVWGTPKGGDVFHR